MKAKDEQRSPGRSAVAGLAIFAIYVIVLALAAVSEVFDLGWFDHPLFK